MKYIYAMKNQLDVTRRTWDGQKVWSVPVCIELKMSYSSGGDGPLEDSTGVAVIS